jgi:ATP-dependent Lhr-like helicase
MNAPAPLAARIDQWLDARGWSAFPFQRDVWSHVAAGRSGLLHATTGAGKTYAVWLGALRAFGEPAVRGAAPLTVLWLTPMRALAADTARALEAPLEPLGVGWTIGIRTGDTSGAQRAKQSRRLPSALVTTPESLSLLLTRPDARERFAGLRMVVADEWHELLGNKRGVQVQLALARLARWNPRLVVWGLSATLGNLDEAARVLLGNRDDGVQVRGRVPKELVIDTLMPPTIERFPWGGHMGRNLVNEVVAEIDATEGSTLLFTNTRSQAELWYQALLERRPDWAGIVALHHGSLDRKLRDWVELGLKDGTLKAVVCTSSLDLGVDFLPVARVLQLGSPKGVARLMQRAGRSGHAPGRVSRVTCVPTHSFELVEAAAARRAAQAQRIESRRPPYQPLDVLVQHLVTIALGGGFLSRELLDEVRATHAYRDLTDAEWQWALDFVVHGGATLGAYPEYHRVAIDAQGVHLVQDTQIARRHRMSVGTIMSDASMALRWMTGGRIGHVEESFVSMLRKGDHFLFAGKLLELARIHEMTAYVRRAKPGKGVVPRWMGAKMPLSSELSDAVRELLDAARAGRYPEPEVAALAPLFEVQARWSCIPGHDEVLIETLASREGHHFFCFAFGGRHVHVGLANLIAWRAARDRPGSFSMSVNDYGFELLSPEPVDWEAQLAAGLFDTARLDDDVLESLNAGELARRRFREVARIAGLVFQGFPGQPKSTRQLQASSELFFDVFTKYDPANLLVRQAKLEVLEQELELSRLRTVLARMNAATLRVVRTARPTPLAFPLLVARIREKFTNEKVADRVARMLAELEAAADAPRHAAPSPRRPRARR